jgi:DNA-binding CsgD family transcriptional regulator
VQQVNEVAARAARLSERQKEILRLVDQHLQSKEIARRLGIGRRTIDKHIAAAMVHLGVANRRDAARALARSEGERFPPEPRPLSAPPSIQPTLPPDTGERWTGAIEFAEAQSSFRHGDLGSSIPRRFPLRGGNAHDLTTAQRIGWMMALPFLIAFALSFFLIGFSALSELGRAISRIFA